MVNLNKFRNSDDAVTSVVGVILMVSVTIIIASVLAAFVFGVDNQEEAPKASLNLEKTTVDDNNTLVVVHQGGDSIEMSDVEATLNMNEVNIASDAPDKFNAGDNLYIYDEGNGNYKLDDDKPTNPWNVVGEGTKATTKFVDIESQQRIFQDHVEF